MKNYREVKIGPYSAYAIAKKNGFEGTEEEWLESLKPPAVDPTLSEEGKAADAKVTGDELARKAVIDDTTVGTDAWSAKHLVDMLCPPISETGNPMVCYPVAGYPLGCKASWEPTQEGEGTPYPAGGGPNLLDISKCTATVGKPYGVTITIDGDVFKVSGVPSSEVTEKGQYSFAVASCTQTELRGKGYKITPFALKGDVSSAWGLRTEDEASLAIAAKLTPGVNTDIQLRLMVSKDTPAAYAPYENIRPISGRDAVIVERCGENLIDSARVVEVSAPYGLTVQYVSGKITISGIYSNPSATASFTFMSLSYRLPPTTEFMLLGLKTSGCKTDGVRFTNNKARNRIAIDIKECTNGEKVEISFYLIAYVGTTAPTTYAPYTGQTTTLTLPRTIYGGSVDAVTGEGQETWKALTFDGTEEWFADNDYAYIPKNEYILAEVNVPAYSNQYLYHPKYSTQEGQTYMTASGARYLEFGPVDSVSAWIDHLVAQKAKGTPVQVAIAPKTPTSFTATGAQPIPALNGVNTVLTDADSVTVTGRADPIKRITDLEDAVASMTTT